MSAPIQASQNAYAGLWNAFTNAAGRYGYRSVDNRGVIVKTTKKGAVVAESMFFLQQWPYKAVSVHRQVDVVVRVSETLSDDCRKILCATTNVGYYRRENDTLLPRLTVHYDFEHEVPEAHPVFHLQVGTPRWSIGQLGKLGLGPDNRADAAPGVLMIQRAPKDLVAAETTQEPDTACGPAPDEVVDYGQARVPTAFVGFAQVLLALAADHLEPRSFRQVLAKAREVARLVPRAGSAHFDSRVSQGEFPAIADWYDERYEVRTKSTNNKIRARVTALAIEVEARNRQELHKTLEQKHRLGPRDVCLREQAHDS